MAGLIVLDKVGIKQFSILSPVTDVIFTHDKRNIADYSMSESV